MRCHEFFTELFGQNRGGHASTPSAAIAKGGKYHDAYREILENANQVINGGWRKTPPSDAEIALGFTAFGVWLIAGQSSSDPYYYSYPSESTRQMTLQLVEDIARSPSVLSAIRRKHPQFNPARELALAETKPDRNHPEWGESVTRWMIMMCRSLGMAATGQIGELRFTQYLPPRDWREIGIELTRSSFGRDAAATIWHY